MGTLHWEKESYHRQKITGALQRRGMIPDTKEDWEIHGPHESFNYQVYVGYAISKNDPSDSALVAIYPRGVYEVEDRSDWYKRLPEKRIVVEE
jgi:hypothetical protein